LAQNKIYILWGMKSRRARTNGFPGLETPGSQSSVPNFVYENMWTFAERHSSRPKSSVSSKFKNDYLANEAAEGDPGVCEIVVAIEERLSVHGGRADELLLMAENRKIIYFYLSL
jgi:hypothetical protein